MDNFLINAFFLVIIKVFSNEAVLTPQFIMVKWMPIIKMLNDDFYICRNVEKSHRLFE